MPLSLPSFCPRLVQGLVLGPCFPILNPLTNRSDMNFFAPFLLIKIKIFIQPVSLRNLNLGGRRSLKREHLSLFHILAAPLVLSSRFHCVVNTAHHTIPWFYTRFHFISYSIASLHIISPFSCWHKLKTTTKDFYWCFTDLSFTRNHNSQHQLGLGVLHISWAHILMVGIWWFPTNFFIMISRFALWVIFFHDFPENDPFITGAFLDITLWREDGGIFISCETGNIKAIFTDEI